MRIMAKLSSLAISQLIGGTCRTLGVPVGPAAAEGVAEFLTRHFLDNSQRLNLALERANERAWKALEVALAGESLWDRCKLVFASSDEKAFREQIKPFLASCPMADLHGKDRFRQDCLKELREAGHAGLFGGTGLDPASLARQAGVFARFSDPQAMLDAEAKTLGEVADELASAGYRNLSAFVAIRPREGDPLIVVAARYFFRRAIEDDAALFQGLAFAQLESLQKGQEAGFDGLNQALNQFGRRLEQVLDDIATAVAATHEAVLDVREEQRRQGAQARDIYQAVMDLQSKLDMNNREVRPRDSLSLRNDSERRLVKELVGRYRNLPEGQRRELPALLNAIGQLEVAAGDFQAAQTDFAAVATLTENPKAKAEAHHNAYRAALERRDWDTALNELKEAAKLDRDRFAPFPLDKFQPKRILGAGGFGVAFLCRHRYLNADVVVKTLMGEDLDRGIDEVFAEGQALRQLDHPAIIRLQDCGFAGTDESRPYLVMDFFEGSTLETLARDKPLSADELLTLARMVASGLHAAHGKGILHRDVKPANLLVKRPEASGGSQPPEWNAKLIDFGLALRRTGKETMLATTATITGSSIAGTLDYAAPEQMGKLPGVAVTPASDVYGFAKTCCYALFQTPQPLLRHWRSVPPALAELLESCLEDSPDQRPRDFGVVLERLASIGAPLAPPPPKPAVELPVVAPVELPPPPTGPVDGMTLEQRRQELADLSRRVAGCTRCAPLVANRTRTVFGTGPLDPAICFIGEAPGADEDRAGEPFIGPAGQLLNRVLSEVGIPREDAYVLNLLKCRPPGNRTPLAGEVHNCRPFLDRQMELVRPRSIVALGGCASQNLLGTMESIGRLRGRLHDYKGIPVLCTYHPAFLLPGRSPEKKREVVEDLKVLLRRLGWWKGA